MIHLEMTSPFTADDVKVITALAAALGGASALAIAATDTDKPEPDPATRTMAEAVATGLLDPSAPVDAAKAGVAAAVAAGADLDADGLPWDTRIHASTKTKTKDGKWKVARNIDPALKATVEAELRQVMAAAPAHDDPAAAFPPPPGGNVPAPPGIAAPSGPASADASSSTSTTAPPPASPSSGVVVPPPPAETSEPPFARIMKLVVAKQAAGTLNTETVNGLCAALGLTKLPDLAARPDLIPAFEAMLPA